MAPDEVVVFSPEKEAFEKDGESRDNGDPMWTMSSRSAFRTSTTSVSVDGLLGPGETAHSILQSIRHLRLGSETRFY